MVAHWSVELGCVDSRSVSIEASFECCLGFPNILDSTNSASDEIHDISGSTSDVSLRVVREAGRVAGERVTLVDVYATNDAPTG